MHDSRSLTYSAALGAVLALAWFRYAPAPFAGVLILAGAWCSFAGYHSSRDGFRAGLISLAAAAFTLGMAEGYWWRRLHQREAPSVDYPESYLARDPDLGYAPVKGAVQRLSRAKGDTVIYDVEYTIDSLGLRVSPTPKMPVPTECILFFGDSYTIGEGVPDTETMPYRVGVRTDGRYHVFNFGVHGYGPHQMLAQLETDRVSRVLDCAPRYAIYQAIPAHVARAAGRAGLPGPRYRFQSDHSVRRDGTLLEDVGPLTWTGYVLSQLNKSALLNVIRARVRPEDRELFLAIVAKAAATVEREYPGAEFHVLLWLNDPARENWMAMGLRARGIRVHLIDDVLVNPGGDGEALRLPGDGHPSAVAHDQIAAYVVQQILHHE